MFYHHCQIFQVSSFLLAHQSRHHEDQMQMCQMKSSSKRSRVKTCCFHFLVLFMDPSHCHTCDYTTVLQQPLWIKHCTNHSVSSSFGDLTLNPFFFFFCTGTKKVTIQNSHWNSLFWHKISLLLMRKTISNVVDPSGGKRNRASGCSTQSSPVPKWKYLQRSLGRPR